MSSSSDEHKCWQRLQLPSCPNTVVAAGDCLILQYVLQD
jgi:hypothetical protein